MVDHEQEFMCDAVVFCIPCLLLLVSLELLLLPSSCRFLASPGRRDDMSIIATIRDYFVPLGFQIIRTCCVL